MKKIKFTAELLLTVACLYMIYALVKKNTPADPADVDMAVAKQIGLENLDMADMSEDEAQQYLINAENIDDLKTRAQAEAQRMIETGDTSLYEEEMERQGIDVEEMKEGL